VQLIIATAWGMHLDPLVCFKDVMLKGTATYLLDTCLAVPFMHMVAADSLPLAASGPQVLLGHVPGVHQRYRHPGLTALGGLILLQSPLVLTTVDS
jgi:hypothetical protein